MAKKSIAAKQRDGSSMEITKEEKVLLQMYRFLSRWDRNFLFLMLQSWAWGRRTPATDHDSWEQISAKTGLPKARKVTA